MADLKHSWKDTGTGLGGAFKHLGKTLINTGKKGVDKAVDWAERDDSAPIPAEYTDVTSEAAEVPAAAAEAAEAETVPVADEIRKLAQLRDEGILTEEEFTAKKQQLLGL